jgi:hypothetical protein
LINSPKLCFPALFGVKNKKKNSMKNCVVPPPKWCPLLSPPPIPHHPLYPITPYTPSPLIPHHPLTPYITSPHVPHHPLYPITPHTPPPLVPHHPLYPLTPSQAFCFPTVKDWIYAYLSKSVDGLQRSKHLMWSAISRTWDTVQGKTLFLLKSGACRGELVLITWTFFEIRQ